MHEFLPVSHDDMSRMGLNYLDFICVTGDAYVDHPSFGTAIISRVIEAEGYSVGIIAQPDYHTADSMKLFGRPRYGFFVNSGNIDSMVAHYTAAKKPRSKDLYSPGGKAHLRPDRAVAVYTKLIHEAYPGVPVIIGGLEASLRRFAHYDYWADRVMPSILADSGADMLVYGMGENQTIQIVGRLAKHDKISDLTDIRGTCYFAKEPINEGRFVNCPSYDEVCHDKNAYAKACRIEYEQHDAVIGMTVVQQHGDRYLIQNPPMPPLTSEELDRVYALPYMRAWHPMYTLQGGVPAIEEVEFSITHNRGCFGACSFCSIAFHQGRTVTSRSPESILTEAKQLIASPGFKGYIHDVGGPTANFRAPSCQKQLKSGMCRGKRCLAPEPCKNLSVSHREYLDILRRLRALPGIKKVFVRSGLRYDYIMADRDNTFLRELVTHHVSGHLKVAPEHCSAAVLDCMGKPHIGTYLEFMKKFYEITKSAGKEQYIVPYLMSSHPGSTLKDAVELALFLKREHIRPEQVQDFYPTPGTISTCMFYTGLDPFTMKPVFVPKSAEEKAMQRALLQYYEPKNAALVEKALLLAKRRDLIGHTAECLVTPQSAQTKKLLEHDRQKRNGKQFSNNSHIIKSRSTREKPIRYKK